MEENTFLFYNYVTNVKLYQLVTYERYTCMAILVVGGAGYIGSHTVRTLQRAGRDVIVFDNFEKGHPEAIARRAVFKGDVRRPDDIHAFSNSIPSKRLCTSPPTLRSASPCSARSAIMKTISTAR